jgi:hypothetical protein
MAAVQKRTDRHRKRRRVSSFNNNCEGPGVHVPYRNCSQTILRSFPPSAFGGRALRGCGGDRFCETATLRCENVRRFDVAMMGGIIAGDGLYSMAAHPLREKSCTITANSELVVLVITLREFPASVCVSAVS